MKRLAALWGKKSASRGRKGSRRQVEWLERRTLFSISPQGNEALDGLITHGGACGCPICAGWGNNVPAEVADDPYSVFAPPNESPAAANEPLHALANLPQLNSLASSQYSLHLDFDGHFEATWGSYSNVNTPVFDRDGDASSFSNSEIDTIVEIWTRVSEDFAPFNINVTTVDPGNFANGTALKVAIGGHWSDWLGSSAGGVAYINSFTNWIANTVYVFPKALGNGYAKYVAEAASHEAGHGFGLLHQASYSGTQKTAEYNSGNSGWAPVMGVGYYSAVSTWYDGPSSNGYNAYQDDLAILSRSTNQFGYRVDDHGSAPQTATQLQVSGSAIASSGIIERNNDVDYFRFTTTGGSVSIGVSTIDVGANLDAVLELRDANNSLISIANPTNSRGASLTANLASGTYYVAVHSTGVYGHIGQYTLSGTVSGATDNNDPDPPDDSASPSTVGLYAQASGGVFLRNVNAAGSADAMFSYGPAGKNWVSLAGDWNGDGQTTIGLYDPTTSTFFLKNSNSTGTADVMFQFGPAGQNWVPLAGDWDQNGTDTVGLYDPSGGRFFLQNANVGGAADVMFQYGPAGQSIKPLVGDWNGDGRTTVGLFNATNGAFFLNNANAGGAAAHVFSFGPAGSNWTPIAGDWNGDGTSGVGFYNGGSFFLKNSFVGGAADATFNFGPTNSGWTPMVGVWTASPNATPSQASSGFYSTALTSAGTSIDLAAAVAIDAGSPIEASPSHAPLAVSYAQPRTALDRVDNPRPVGDVSLRPTSTVGISLDCSTSRSSQPASSPLDPSQVDQLFAAELDALLSSVL